MNTSLDCFSRGLVRAFERRAKEQAKQTVQNVDSDVTTISTTGKVVNNTTTQKTSDEQYQATIIPLMVNHIRQKKEKTK